MWTFHKKQAMVANGKTKALKHHYNNYCSFIQCMAAITIFTGPS